MAQCVWSYVFIPPGQMPGGEPAASCGRFVLSLLRNRPTVFGSGCSRGCFSLFACIALLPSPRPPQPCIQGAALKRKQPGQRSVQITALKLAPGPHDEGDMGFTAARGAGGEGKLRSEETPRARVSCRPIPGPSLRARCGPGRVSARGSGHSRGTVATGEPCL